MIIYKTKLEKQYHDRITGIYDIEGYEGELVRPYKGFIYNLNGNHTYRVDFKGKVIFLLDGRELEVDKIIYR